MDVIALMKLCGTLDHTGHFLNVFYYMVTLRETNLKLKKLKMYMREK